MDYYERAKNPEIPAIKDQLKLRGAILLNFRLKQRVSFSNPEFSCDNLRHSILVSEAHSKLRININSRGLITNRHHEVQT